MNQNFFTKKQLLIISTLKLNNHEIEFSENTILIHFNNKF
jgi:hypothetical protein